MESKKVIPGKVSREAYQSLRDIVGPEWISEDRAIVEACSKTALAPDISLRKHAKDPSCIPVCVVVPEDTDQVQAIVRVAGRYKVPITPLTNGQLGAVTVPNTIIVHLRRMDKVLGIDEKNMTATVQPYVSYAQLQAEAMKRGLWNGGCPLATSITKIVSNASMAGQWQTDLKYAGLNRNILNIKAVLSDGSLLDTGSFTVSGAGKFREYGPGPDLTGLIRGCMATFGIFTEVTVKLHPWVGETSFPEDVGRPSIATYYNDIKEKKFDRPPLPDNHKIFWIEYPDLETEIDALYMIAHSGIGIALNASGVYSDYYCSQTQEMTEKRATEHFFPPFNSYVMIAGISSPKQLEYEEKVLRDIIEEVGGRFLTPEEDGEILDALTTWNQDCFRHVCGFRMNRRGSFIMGYLPSFRISQGVPLSESWREVLERVGPVHLTDRGGGDSTPFLYIFNRGHFCMAETDHYYSQADPRELQKTMELVFDNEAAMVSKNLAYNISNIHFEPLTSFYPEVGPNLHLIWRKLRAAFDPQGICAPGRQVFTEGELKEVPQELIDVVNRGRTAHGMVSLKKEDLLK